MGVPIGLRSALFGPAGCSFHGNYWHLGPAVLVPWQLSASGRQGARSMVIIGLIPLSPPSSYAAIWKTPPFRGICKGRDKRRYYGRYKGRYKGLTCRGRYKGRCKRRSLSVLTFSVFAGFPGDTQGALQETLQWTLQGTLQGTYIIYRPPVS